MTDTQNASLSGDALADAAQRLREAVAAAFIG